MSRVDVPTLKCDRCGFMTQDTHVMMQFADLSHSHMSGTDKWDLCSECWKSFMKFIDPEEAPDAHE